MSMLSRWTIGAMASKKARASCPVSAAIACGQRRAGQRAGGDDRRMVGQRVDPLAHDRDVRMRRRRARVTSSAKASRSTASADPAGTLCWSAQRMISEPSRRISWWSRPTALFSASSERKLFEQTISASRSLSCAGVVSPPPRISLRRTVQPGLGQLPRRLAPGQPAADDVDVESHAALPICHAAPFRPAASCRSSPTQLQTWRTQHASSGNPANRSLSRQHTADDRPQNGNAVAARDCRPHHEDAADPVGARPAKSRGSRSTG